MCAYAPNEGREIDKEGKKRYENALSLYAWTPFPLLRLILEHVHHSAFLISVQLLVLLLLHFAVSTMMADRFIAFIVIVIILFCNSSVWHFTYYYVIYAPQPHQFEIMHDVISYFLRIFSLSLPLSLFISLCLSFLFVSMSFHSMHCIDHCLAADAQIERIHTHTLTAYWERLQQVDAVALAALHLLFLLSLINKQS